MSPPRPGPSQPASSTGSLLVHGIEWFTVVDEAVLANRVGDTLWEARHRSSTPRTRSPGVLPPSPGHGRRQSPTRHRATRDALALPQPLSERRTILLPDNARALDQLHPLLPGADRCLTIVTSRSQLLGLLAVIGAVPLSPGSLTDDEAHELLTR
ncbi:hypothetical protein ACIRH0_41245 [Streptomyces sp. NPDC093675]|uniref:hypothetical protein n=1 Tax=Streptomyces sp. NPDC093675 TaxID=3366049 RepID=UPI003827F4FD